MDGCYEGTTVPTPIEEPCGGEYISTSCVSTPSAIPVLGIVAGASQTQINTAIANAITYKEQQIEGILDSINPLINTQILKGSFLGSTLTIVSDNINDVTINNIATGVYNLSSESFTPSTLILITPNGGLGYDNITVSYDYTNVDTGVITFRVKNAGLLINLFETPIKIEI
jgi:hypothetical protein